MLGREVIKRQQDISILRQTFDSLGIFGLERRGEQIKGSPSLLLRLGHPDIMQHRFGLGLKRFGHLIEHIGCLMDPATLLACDRVYLPKGRPEAQCPIAGGQLGCLR